MSKNINELSEEDLKKRDEEISKTLDKLIQIGEKFMETDEYKNSSLSDDYKSRIVKVFPIFLDALMKGDMEELFERVQYMDAGDAFVLGMLTGRLFFNMTKKRI